MTTTGNIFVTAATDYSSSYTIHHRYYIFVKSCFCLYGFPKEWQKHSLNTIMKTCSWTHFQPFFLSASITVDKGWKLNFEFLYFLCRLFYLNSRTKEWDICNVYCYSQLYIFSDNFVKNNNSVCILQYHCQTDILKKIHENFYHFDWYLFFSI